MLSCRLSRLACASRLFLCGQTGNSIKKMKIRAILRWILAISTLTA
ncbi:hypothetical protein DDI_4359 [Dickeya dianthicola RNS04.9]|nr:hypothetical protein DDI_4359 [Dickeya dianthicola RNS04.9]